MWEKLAEKVVEAGGKINTNSRVVGLTTAGNRVVQVTVQKGNDNSSVDIPCEHVISTMPVQELLRAITPAPPPEAVRVSDGLKYRDFITVGVLLQKMKTGNETSTPSINNIIPDTWMYIQEPDIKIGRIQIYNNWSPYMVKDPATIWLGLEYFCNEGGGLWSKTDEELSDFAVDELVKIEMAEKGDVLDTTVVRMKKAYPAYFGSYGDFDVIRQYTDTIENIYLVGRNGMHRYNNMDHSMLTAMTAVDNIRNGSNSKDNIWQVDTDD